MNFATAQQLQELCERHQLPISQIMFQREIQVVGNSAQDVRRRMAHSYQIMRDAVRQSLEEPLQTMGGLIGGEAKKMAARRELTPSACGPLPARAAAYALGVLEVNASMGLIVAAPTAGSSGVLPGVLLALQEEHGLLEEQMLEGLYHAAAIGYLIAHNATVSGAEGGCQAEVGAASAMAASAVVELLGGPPAQSLTAASLAISNLMGLVCDPIAGLVEAPCQSRNALGATNALLCAEMALAGITIPVPFDEMVDAMYRVGRSLPHELRETALGGVAATPSARRCASCLL